MFLIWTSVVTAQPPSPPPPSQPVQPISNPEPGVPFISESNRQFLSRLARRAVRDSILGRDLYEPTYVPTEIQSVQYEVVIRLRRWGYLLGIGVAGPAPLSNAIRDAALSALQVVRAQRELAVEDANQLLIEIEVVGEAVPLQIPGDWTQPGVADAYIEPGAHGVYFRGTRGVNRIFPTDIVTQDIVVSDAFKLVAQRILAAPDEVTKTELKRFRTAHWYEPNSGAAVISLKRGLVFVPPEFVTAKDLDQAIERLAEYMAYRQQTTGLFSYQYEPSSDSYTDDDNTVRQAGAMLALSMHARQSAGSASRAAADVGLRHFLDGLTQILDVENAAFIATKDQRNKLGVTALICAALAVHPDAPSHANTRRKLINGMLWLQR
ncbi:MAG: hypothetical protein AABZ47_15325, partial [Planctomycetota bacterium]